MGFYKNTNTRKANRRAVAETVFKYLSETNGKDFGLVSLSGFNGSLARPAGIDFSKVRAFDTYINNEPDFYSDEQYTDNSWFRVEDDLKITFKTAVLIHRLSAKDIPFFLSEQNSVCISHVDDDVFDWLPESLNCIWINNAVRSDGSISFKNLKRVGWVSVVGCTKLKSLKGLEDLTAKNNVYIRYNKKLTTTEFAPRIDSSAKLAIPLSGAAYDASGTYSITNNPELEEININPKSTVCRIFIDDTCKKVNKVTSLPSSTTMFFCKTLTTADLIPIRDAGTEIGYVELADFKGKGDAMKNLTSSASEDSVKDQLKKIVDDIKAKHWRVFDDLYAVLSFYNLEEYAGFTEKSRYVEDGMIHSYDPVGERYRINYYASGVHRNNIKNGVCRYLNQLGVKYTIINTGAKAKKETEFIKIQA